jgi:arylsulfatase A-like enzyme
MNKYLKNSKILFLFLFVMFIMKIGQCEQKASLPNFIIIFCNDLGYGDIACYDSEINRTPNIDRMAEEGFKFTSFYASASVCTSFRASLLTGCYAQRNDMAEARPEGFRSVL